MTTIAVIQARMGSNRLPGKVLEDLGGAPVLQRVVDRVRRASTVDTVVVATSDTPTDDALATYCAHHGIAVVRGSEHDVLSRFGDVLTAYPEARQVVRITADCPLVDPEVIDDVVAALVDGEADFAANRLPPPYPRTYPVGLDVEAVTRSALEAAMTTATAPRDREHVMPYLYTVPGRFRTVVIDLDHDLSAHRWTIDTPADLDAVRELWSLLPAEFTWHDAVRVSDEHPEIAAINAAVVQKKLDAVDERWVTPRPDAG